MISAGSEKGRRGEDIAAACLEKNGYTIIDRNYHSAYGEIDIIAEKGGYIIFAEVKLRKKNSRVGALEAVSPSKQKKIISTAVIYMQSCAVSLQPRFDVIAVTDYENGEYKTEHIKSAFDTQDVFC